MFINGDSLKKALKHDVRLLLYPVIDSTNTEARRLVESGAQGDLLLIADGQTGGRGRHGKSFYSPKGTGLYMSLVLRRDGKAETAQGITCAAAVAVCRAIEELTALKPQIKWVNDVYIGDKKVCGILCETVGSPDGSIKAVIIGIGINIKTPDFPEYAEIGGSLNLDIDRAELAAAVINGVYGLAGGGYMEYYRRHSMLTGKEIEFVKNGVSTHAKVVGIDSGGGLAVLLEDGSSATLTSGEVSVRIR